MYTLFVIIHVIVSLVLCVVVLLQSGKGGGLAGAFGGGGGAPQQMLGSRGMSTLLHKVTIWCGVGFMITSLALFMMSGTQTTGSGGVLEDAQQRGEFGQPAPTAPIEMPVETPPPASGGAESGEDGTSGGGGAD